MPRQKFQVYLDEILVQRLEYFKEKNDIENISQTIDYILGLYFELRTAKPKDIEHLISQREFKDYQDKEKKEIDELKESHRLLLEATNFLHQELQLLKESSTTVKTTTKPTTKTRTKKELSTNGN